MGKRSSGYLTMNSIDRNQPEENLENFAGLDAVSKIKAMVVASPTCFFCTAVTTPGSHAVRPMSVQQVDEEGNLWFLSPDDSHKNLELEQNPDVKLYFQGSQHSDFLYLEGYATISKDKDKIRELWDPIMKTWFTEGQDDPRITVICFSPAEGYYWDTKHGTVVAGAKMLVGALTGTTLDDSIQGNLKVR